MRSKTTYKISLTIDDFLKRGKYYSRTLGQGLIWFCDVDMI